MTLPLDGLRVIDFTQVWAGPQISACLGDMGAEVVRVESNAGTDVQRNTNREKSEMRKLLETHWYYRSREYYVTLNLLKEEGVALLKRMLHWGDVLVLNLSPHKQRALGVDYETLRKEKPDLILVAFSAAGQWGPYDDLLAFGPSMNIAVGSDALVGYPEDHGKPMLHVWDPDPGMGVMLGYAILTAVFHRSRTGEGQLVDLPFSELLPNFLGEPILEYQISGEVPKPKGNRHPHMAPHEIYPSSGEDTWVSIAVATEEEWRSFCTVIGEPDLAADPRFATLSARQANLAVLDETVSTWTRSCSNIQATHLLQQAGVAAAPAYKVSELYHDPHDISRRTSINVNVDNLNANDVTYGIPWRLSETPGAIRGLGRPLGADNKRFFGGELQLDPTEIKRLIEGQVIY